MTKQSNANSDQDDLDVILKALESPKTIPKGTDFENPNHPGPYEHNKYSFTNVELVRQNPETWIYFCTAYWYTLNQKVHFPDGIKGEPI